MKTESGISKLYLTILGRSTRSIHRRRVEKSRAYNSLTFDPCGNVSETGDYFSVMRKNMVNLKRMFSQFGSPIL